MGGSPEGGQMGGSPKGDRWDLPLSERVMALDFDYFAFALTAASYLSVAETATEE